MNSDGSIQYSDKPAKKKDETGGIQRKLSFRNPLDQDFDEHHQIVNKPILENALVSELSKNLIDQVKNL